MLTLDSICTNDKILTAIKLVKMLLQLLQILVPIALIVLGSLDLGKAVVSLDEGAAKKGQKRFINRCIAAVLVFLSAIIVRTAMGFIGNDAWQACWDNIAAVKAVTCNYSATESIKISYKNDVKYTTVMCDNAGGLTAGDFSNGCPNTVYYKVTTSGSLDTYCAFTTKQQPSTSGYSKATLTSSEAYSEVVDGTDDSN
jgi:hypothetical protein